MLDFMYIIGVAVVIVASIAGASRCDDLARTKKADQRIECAKVYSIKECVELLP